MLTTLQDSLESDIVHQHQNDAVTSLASAAHRSSFLVRILLSGAPFGRANVIEYALTESSRSESERACLGEARVTSTCYQLQGQPAMSSTPSFAPNVAMHCPFHNLGRACERGTMHAWYHRTQYGLRQWSWQDKRCRITTDATSARCAALPAAHTLSTCFNTS